MRGIVQAVLMLSAATAAVASQAAVKVRYPQCESRTRCSRPPARRPSCYARTRASTWSIFRMEASGCSSRPHATSTRCPSRRMENGSRDRFSDGTVEVPPPPKAPAPRASGKLDANRIDNLYFFADGKKLFVSAMNHPGTIWELTDAKFARHFGGQVRWSGVGCGKP